MAEPANQRAPHGTHVVPGRRHPVLDIAYWDSLLDIGDEEVFRGGINSPLDLARVERYRRQAAVHVEIGSTTPCDIFVWSQHVGFDEDQRLTRLGGLPWRDRKLAWPTDGQGHFLQFLGQINFSDSTDLVPFELPGEVLLFFGSWGGGSVWSPPDAIYFEWAPEELKSPFEFGDEPLSLCLLPFHYEGVIHRTVQYSDLKQADLAFETAGFEDSWYLGQMQGTLIGSRAEIPQGWPLDDDAGETLIACLGSFYFSGDWPLCNVATAIQVVRHDGTSFGLTSDALSMGIQDAGCAWVFRTHDGRYALDAAGG
ncbi:MAG: DUF1963 domain-containing protein [Planctomycetota bacterium]